MDQISYVHDCTGNLILLDQFVSGYNDNLVRLSNEQYIQLAEAVSTADLIFEFEHAFTRYYYRSLGLNRCLLTGATFSNGMWKVNNYFDNPSGSFLLTLFRGYLQKGSLSMYLKNEMAADYFEIKQVVQLGKTVAGASFE